ncbi:hypothetical protein COCOBI_16-3740 [Coccomyxa sp. Obi]|nr:hypothetical protein COCOBI_16-3740 [Coccomyxa sp. Obi]
MEEIRGPTMEELNRWRGRQGPKLRALLAAQESQHPPVRQKTVEQKTWCPCENGMNGRRGTARGVWCGNCLWLRMGQNLNEVLPLCEEGVWRCPSCLDLCNCSGRSCSRFQKGLEPTDQLHSEAVRQGFKSAAHYLVETLLSEEAVTAAIGSVYEGRLHHRARTEDPQEGPFQAARRGAKNHKERVQQRAKQKLEEQFALMHEAFAALQQPDVPLDRMADSAVAMALDADEGDDSDEDGGADFGSPFGAAASTGPVVGGAERDVPQRCNQAPAVAGSAAAALLDFSPASAAPAVLSEADHSRPCKRRRQNSGASQQPEDVGDLGDLDMGGRWDGAHSGLSGNRDRTPHQRASRAAIGRQTSNLHRQQGQQRHQFDPDDVTPMQQPAGAALGFLESVVNIPALLEAAADDPPMRALVIDGFRTQWLKGVLDLFGENITIPLSTGGKAQDVNLDKLRKVLKVLVVAARVLPEDEVPYTVARRLFGLEHFVEFETSDPASRSYLLSAAFELLDIAWQRSILLEEITSGIMAFVALLVKEHEALYDWKQNATKHFLDRDSLCIGPFRQDPPWTDDNRIEAEALLELGEKSNEHLLKTALDRIALAMLGPSLKEYPSEEHLALLGEPLLGLLDENARIAAPVRRKALDLLARVICSVRDPPFSATANQMDMDDEFLDLLTVRTALGRRLRDVRLRERLEAAIAARFPQRAAGRDLGVALVAAPLPGERAVTEVTDFAFAVLAKLYGLLASSNLVKWKDVIPYTMLPYSEARFWTSANAAYRNFAVLFLANVLEVFPQPLPALHTALLHVWLRALLDTERRESAYWITLGMSRVAGGPPDCPGPGELFWAAGVRRRQLQQLRQDRSGEARAELIRCVFSAMATHQRWRERFGELLADIGDVLAKRLTEPRRPRELAAWQQAAAGILLGAVSGAGLGPCMCRQPPNSCSCGGAALLTVLGHISRWAGSASVILQRWWATAALQLEGRDPAPPRDLLEADARQRLERTVFRHVRRLFSMVATLFFAVRSAPAPAPVLELLRTLLMSAIEVPTGDESANPADSALYDGVAKALLREDEAQMVLPALAVECQDAHMRMLHFLIGTQLRRHIERAQNVKGRAAVIERTAVNLLRLLRAVLGRPALRGSSAAFRMLLPPLLRPLLDLLRPPGMGTEASLAAKEALYALLIDLLRDSATAIVPPVLVQGDPPIATSARVVIGRVGGPLQQCQPLSEDKWQAAMQVFVRVLCREGLSCVAGASDTVRPVSMHEQSCLTPLDHQGMEEARSTLFILLGQPRPQDATNRLFETKQPIEVPATYEPVAAEDAPGLSPDERHLRQPPLQPAAAAQFRPGDFKWRVAERAVGFLRALAASGPDGAAWAAACTPTLRALLAANASLHSMLSAPYKELLAAMEVAGQDIRQLGLPNWAPGAAAPLARSTSRGPARPGSMAGSRGPVGPSGHQHNSMMQENRPPQSAPNLASSAPAPVIKPEPQQPKVMTTVAEVQAAMSRTAQVALKLMLASTPHLKTKPSDSSKVLLFDLRELPAADGVTPTGGDQGSVKIFWIHDAERLHSAFTVRGLAGGSCMVTLTKMQPLQSGNMFKSTEQSRAYLSDVPRPGNAASLNVHPMDGAGAPELAATRQLPQSGQALGQHPAVDTGGMGRLPQQQAEAGAVITAQTGGSCGGNPSLEWRQAEAEGRLDRNGMATFTQSSTHKSMPSQASTVPYGGVSTLHCSNDWEAGPSMPQVCTPYDPLEAGRARLQAQVQRLLEMGFAQEAAKEALREAGREGLMDKAALERAAELLARGC